jgi:ATP adenylyltransferase
MPYIEQAQPTPGCLFCTIASEDRDEENLVLYRGPRCFVMMNLYPYNSGHLMVVPYQHTGDLERIDPQVGYEIFAVSQTSVRILKDALGADGFNLGVNQGKIAGAGVADHIHLHIVPRWEGDTNFMPTIADVKVIPQLLSATAKKLKPLFDQRGQNT